MRPKQDHKQNTNKTQTRRTISKIMIQSNEDEKQKEEADEEKDTEED